jgi:hypothetical protein
MAFDEIRKCRYIVGNRGVSVSEQSGPQGSLLAGCAAPDWHEWFIEHARHEELVIRRRVRKMRPRTRCAARLPCSGATSSFRIECSACSRRVRECQPASTQYDNEVPSPKSCVVAWATHLRPPAARRSRLRACGIPASHCSPTSLSDGEHLLRADTPQPSGELQGGFPGTFPGGFRRALEDTEIEYGQIADQAMESRFGKAEFEMLHGVLDHPNGEPKCSRSLLAAVVGEEEARDLAFASRELIAIGVTSIAA